MVVKVGVKVGVMMGVMMGVRTRRGGRMDVSESPVKVIRVLHMLG